MTTETNISYRFFILRIHFFFVFLSNNLYADLKISEYNYLTGRKFYDIYTDLRTIAETYINE